MFQNGNINMSYTDVYNFNMNNESTLSLTADRCTFDTESSNYSYLHFGRSDDVNISNSVISGRIYIN